MKFNIRDLLLVTVVVALVVSWWLDHRRLSLEMKYWETKLSYEKAMADSQKALGEYRSAWQENRERLEASRRAFELLTSPAPPPDPPKNQ